MSCHDKDTLDTSASDSSSDKDLSEAKLEHLRIESMKDDSDESKPQEPPKDTLTSECDPLDEPTAGPSGLQTSSLESSDQESKIPGLAAPQKEKSEKGVDENTETKMEEGESDSSKDVEPTIYENYPPTEGEGPTIYENYPPTEGEGPTIYENYPPGKDAEQTIYENYPPGKDAEQTIYENYPPKMEEEESLSSATDIEPPTFPDHYTPSNSDTSSVDAPFRQSSTGVPRVVRQANEPIAGPSGLQRQMGLFRGPQNIFARYNIVPSSITSLKRSSYKTEKTDSQNTSADFSEIHSEIVDIPAEASVNPEGQVKDAKLSELKDVAPPPAKTSSETSTSTTSESMEGEEISGDNRMLQNVEHGEERSVPAEARRRAYASRHRKPRGEGEPSPSKRRRSSRGLSGSSETEERMVDRLRSRSQKGKMAASISCPALQQPGSESSCSDEFLRRESAPEINILSPAEVSKPTEGRKEHHVPGRLRDFQLSTVSSTSSFISEEDLSTFSREQVPEVEFEDPAPEEMETSPEKGEIPPEDSDPSEAKLSTESSHQAVRSETEETSKSTDESERSVGKYKRDPQLSSSPPSDEKSDSSPKVKAKRSKKKVKSEEMSEPTQGSSQDAESTVPRSVSLGDLQQSDSSTLSEEGDNTI